MSLPNSWGHLMFASTNPVHMTKQIHLTALCWATVCLTAIVRTWKIGLKCGIDGFHIGDDRVEMLVRGAEEMKGNCKGRISEIARVAQ